MRINGTFFCRGYERNLAREKERGIGSIPSHPMTCSLAPALPKGFKYGYR